MEKWTKTCIVCGISSSSHCAKCKNINYCSRVHQILDWKNGHKEFCGTEKELFLKNFLFPQFELIVEAEENFPEQGSKNDDPEKDSEEIKKYEELVKNGQAGSLQFAADIDSALVEMANKVEDKAFFKFQNRIKLDPNQVLRYKFKQNKLFKNDKTSFRKLVTNKIFYSYK